MSPRITVIIVSWNSREHVRGCLRALPAAIEDPQQLAIHVVDNASSDDTVAMLRAEFPPVTVHDPGENLGFARANNLVLARCSTEYALLLNPDTEPLRGSVARLLAFMDAHPDAAAAGPLLVHPDLTPQAESDRDPGLLREFLGLPGVRSLRAFDRLRARLLYLPAAGEKPTPVECLTGACLLVRRAAWEQVGLLDEGFFLYYEDLDWCRRMRCAGWRLYRVPDARVIHYGGQSAARAGRRVHRAFFASRWRYFRKHRGPLAAAAIAVMNALVEGGAAWKERHRERQGAGRNRAPSK